MAAGSSIAVRDSRPLSVDVSELLRRPGASLRVHGASRIDGLGVPSAWVEPGSDLHLDLTVEALVDGLHVTGSVTARTLSRCSRCLREERGELVRDIAEVAAYPGEDRDEVYPVDGERLDLEPIITDAIVGEMPFRPLCTPECRGLCPVCGADRNVTACGHDQAPADARWAPLSELRERLETNERMEE